MAAEGQCNKRASGMEASMKQRCVISDQMEESSLYHQLKQAFQKKKKGIWKINTWKLTAFQAVFYLFYEDDPSGFR